MKKILLSIFVLSMLFANAQIQKDKVLHFVGGSLFGLGGAGIAKQISKGDPVWTFVGAVGASALVGIGKEAIDENQQKGAWDNQDILATVLGGVTVGITLELFRKIPKKSAQNYSAIRWNGNGSSNYHLIWETPPRSLLVFGLSQP